MIGFASSFKAAIRTAAANVPFVPHCRLSAVVAHLFSLDQDRVAHLAELFADQVGGIGKSPDACAGPDAVG